MLKEKGVEVQSSSSVVDLPPPWRLAEELTEEERRWLEFWSENEDLDLGCGSMISVGFGRQPQPPFAVKMLFNL